MFWVLKAVVTKPEQSIPLLSIPPYLYLTPSKVWAFLIIGSAIDSSVCELGEWLLVDRVDAFFTDVFLVRFEDLQLYANNRRIREKENILK